MTAYIKRHLGNGPNKYHWQVKEDGVEVKYFDPFLCNLRMHGCVLKNSKNAAKKIYQGANRQPVAKIACQSYEVIGISSDFDPILLLPIYYDPKVAPYFRSSSGCNIDDRVFDCIVTDKTKTNIAIDKTNFRVIAEISRSSFRAPQMLRPIATGQFLVLKNEESGANLVFHRTERARKWGKNEVFVRLHDLEEMPQSRSPTKVLVEYDSTNNLVRIDNSIYLTGGDLL